MVNILKQRFSGKASLLILLLAFLSTLEFAWLDSQNELSPLVIPLPEPRAVSSPPASVGGITNFVSEEDFKSYLEKSESVLSFSGRGAGTDVLNKGELAPTALPGPSVPQRISETNVQVSGVDEPDIVKTNGQEIYFSQEGYYWRGEIFPVLPGNDISLPGIQSKTSYLFPQSAPKTRLIRAFPPSELKEDSQIDRGGNLLLSKNTLVVFSGQEVYGFDVADSSKPEQKWNLKLGDNVSLVGSRLYQDRIYLITQANIYDRNHPCPIEIWKEGEVSFELKCQDVFHPAEPIAVDTTFTVMALEPISGRVEKSISFVGTGGQSILYVSGSHVYVTYPLYQDVAEFMLGFLKEKAGDVFPAWVKERVQKLSGYDLSQQSKLSEIQFTLEKYFNSLSEDERLEKENELSNRLSDYATEHQREMEKTGIVKIALDGLAVKSSGDFSGSPLNQFSLDEYQGNLRVATTLSQNWWGLGIQFSSTSANDVYVLDQDLKLSGSIKDLGLTERIYSARFVQDKGYLVTFRQTDPFYVLDLSKPKNPKLSGELKIPGFSSYLHPISPDLVLGVGQENWQVKLSLFDVSSPQNPRETDKYILDEGWTEVSSNHHAFLLDPEHKVFFLPGGKGGYVFSYQNNSLKMKKAVAETSIKRAVYLDNYLYIIGENKITVLNESDWEKVNELSF